MSTTQFIFVVGRGYGHVAKWRIRRLAGVDLDDRKAACRGVRRGVRLRSLSNAPARERTRFSASQTATTRQPRTHPQFWRRHPGCRVRRTLEQIHQRLFELTVRVDDTLSRMESLTVLPGFADTHGIVALQGTLLQPEGLVVSEHAARKHHHSVRGAGRRRMLGDPSLGDEMLTGNQGRRARSNRRVDHASGVRSRAGDRSDSSGKAYLDRHAHAAGAGAAGM